MESRRITWLTAACVVAPGLVVGGACSSDSGGEFPGITSSASGAGSDSTSAGPGGGGEVTTAAATGDGGPIFDVGGGMDVGAGADCGCSPDLQTVVCDGEVVAQCGGTTACADGACIDGPCLAAEIAQSSVGCEFYPVKTAIISQGRGACFAAFITNTWDTPVTIQLEYDGLTLPAQGVAKIPSGQGQGLTYADLPPTGLPPGEVAVVFLSREPQAPNIGPPACPVAPAVEIDTGVDGTGRGRSFRITTDRPVAAFQMLPYGAGSAAITAASLLLPTSAWDTNYVAVNAYRKSTATPESQPSLVVVAQEDLTEVTINPVADIVGGPGVASAVAGSPTTYVLDDGETLQINQDIELTGSVIQSDRRVGLFGADSCMNVSPGNYACDSAQQQIPPVRALGSEYVGVRYRARDGQPDESPPWRLVGVVDGTLLTWTPTPPDGAPTALGLGEVYEFSSSGPWVVRSQDDAHPFYAAGYMTGGSGFHGEGDAEWVNLVPTDQYLHNYVFYTDPSYSETSLVLIRKPGAGGFQGVDLDCAGTVGGWTAVGPYEYARVDLVTGNFDPVGGCDNGRHQIGSDAAFGVTVWGWGSNATDIYTRYVSYAYPAGASLQAINDVLVPAG